MLDDKSMQFIEEIYEARMTRNAYGQMELSYTDCCERLYLSVLILALLISIFIYMTLSTQLFDRFLIQTLLIFFYFMQFSNGFNRP